MSGADLSDALRDMWRSVLLFVPTALAFLAILIVGYIVARVIRAVVVKTLRRVGFDRAVERGALGKALGGRVEPSDLCAKLAFYAVLLFALQLAFGIWGPNAVSDLLTALIGWLPRAFVAIVIIVVAAAIGGAVRDLIGSALGGLAYGRVLAQAAYWLIVGLGVIAALEQVRIATAVTQPLLIAVLATVAGVLIVGVGGGLIRPMQRRWETWLDRAGAESAAIREHARSYADERARAATEADDRAKEAAGRAQAAADEKATALRADQQGRKAEQAREAERARTAGAEQHARTAAAAEQARIGAEQAATEAAQRRLLEGSDSEKTQIIPMQRPWPGSDDQPHDARSHPVPGFDAPEPPDPAETTTWLHVGTAPGEPAGGDDTEAQGESAPVHPPGREPVPTDASGRPTHNDTAARVESTAAPAAVTAAGAEGTAGEADGLAAQAGDTVAQAEDTAGQGAGDAETTADVLRHVAGGAQPEGAPDRPDPDRPDPDRPDPDGREPDGRDADSTVSIPRSEWRRQVLPQQGGPAEGEKTQVIRARPE